MLYGWTGKILRVDLSSGHVSTDETGKYAHKYIGGKGLMPRLAWEEIPRGTGAFDAENRLFIAAGPLTGTPAPTSGRIEIGGVSPQSLPEMYSHSGVGSWFGAELKYAGFDTIVIHGKAPAPCYIWINDGNVEIKSAGHLWGLSTCSTQQELRNIHGKTIKSLVIGPAGELRSRIAVILADNGSAAGQGGFGGVAGSKNLKAICVKGSKSLKIARPDELLELRGLMRQPSKNPLSPAGQFEFFNHTIDNVPWKKFNTACTHSCDRQCMPAFVDIHRAKRPGFHSAEMGCIGKMAAGWLHSDGWNDNPPVEWPLWKPDLRRGAEAVELMNEFGLNQYELLAGMVPWIVMAAHEGLLKETDFGFPVNPDEPEWWLKFLEMVAFRKGFGDILAEGTTRAINMLGKEKYGNTIYTGVRRYKHTLRPTPISLQQAWGYAAHWSGRGINASLPFPDWLLRALTWMTQSRDSNNDTHHRSRRAVMDEFRKNPYRGEFGPRMAIWDEHRSEIKCSLTLCDWAFPQPYFSSAESRLYSAVTGLDTTEEELDRSGERFKNLQRAVLIRNNDRSRDIEVTEILEFFKRPDGTKGISIDENEFQIMVSNYYRQRGWDTETGRPTRSKLKDLGLGDVADGLGL